MVEEDGISGVNNVGESMSEVLGLETVLPRRLSAIDWECFRRLTLVLIWWKCGDVVGGGSRGDDGGLAPSLSNGQVSD